MEGLDFTQFILQLEYYFNYFVSLIGEEYFKLLLYTIGIVFYAVIILHFYKSLAKRDIFKLDLKKYDWYDSDKRKMKKVWESFLYALKYGIIFPIYTFIWFSLFSLFLFLLSKATTLEHIIFISVAVVSATRVISYYKEELSADIAKLLPFVLLGVFIVDPSFFSIDLLYVRLSEIAELGPAVIKFLAFSVFLEWILRVLYSIKRAITREVSYQRE